jgi:hypothetical protein
LRLVALVVFLVALALALRTQWKEVAPLLGRTSPLALAAALAGAVTAFGLLGWVLYDALGLASAQLAVAVAGLAGVVVIIASSVPMWNQILRYARGQPIGAGRWGRASRTRRS